MRNQTKNKCSKSNKTAEKQVFLENVLKCENYFSAYYLEDLEQYRNLVPVDSEDRRESYFATH